MYEEIKLEKVEGYCGLCEDYAKKNSTIPTKLQRSILTIRYL